MAVQMSLLSLLLLGATVTARPQLIIKTEPVKIIGSRTMVLLNLTNATAESIHSVKATAFVTNDREVVVGRATRWIVGAVPAKSELAPKESALFSFVVPLDRNYDGTTNLQCRFVFNRLVFANGRIGNVQNDIQISTNASQHP
jgi:hypothetical protein